jgi:parvulin-like peptidyl-prolyl isomerase
VRYWCGLFMVVVFSLVLLTACTKELAPTVVAEVNGDYITVEEFTAELTPLVSGYQNPPSSQEEANFKDLKKALLDQLIDKKIILAEALKMGITVPENELDDAFTRLKKSYPRGGFDELLRNDAALRQWKERLRQRLVIEKVISRVSQPTPAIDEDAVRKYYQKHRTDFISSDQVRVRQIVVKSRQEAENVLSRVKRGESFEELARKHSVAPEAGQGGDLGFFGRGDMPEEFDVVFSLKVGETSGIVQSPYGYHIFQVVAKRGEKESNFDEVKDRIRNMIAQEQEEKVFQRWLKKAKKKASITVNKRALEAIQPSAPSREETPKKK